MKPSTVCFCLNLIFLADHVLAQSSSLSLQQDVRSCTSCVDRSQKTIHAFYHGNEGDPFWRPIVAAANQASINHQVKLKTTLFSSFDAAAMAQDIRQAVQNGGADALIVSTSPPEVRQAVTEAIEEGVAVFGLNSGYNDDTGTQTTSSNNMGFAATIGQDEFRAGQVAAIRFLEAKDVIHKAVFVIEETGQSAMEQRLEGFRQVLLEAHPDAVVEQVQVEDISNPFVSFDVERKLKPFLATCDCDIVLSSGARVSPQVLKYLQHWNQECRQTANFDRTFFGAFDATNDVITRIETGDVLFAISQQPYLQATVPVLLASLYVTTGKILANPSAPIITGPVLIDASNLQSNKLHYCSNLGEIGCKDRATIRIGAVLDNHTAAGQGGQELRAGAEQASRDVGVSLDMFVLEEGSMSEKIESLCQQGVVDGLFISLSSASEAETVQDCESLGVRVIILETEFEHDLEFLKSVGRFQQDNGDTAANYFQGYLPIALLSYLIESNNKFSVPFRFEPGTDTWPLSAFQQTCLTGTVQMCDELPGGNDDSTVDPGEAIDSAIVSPTTTTLTISSQGRSPIDFILKILYILCGLVAIGVLIYLHSCTTNYYLLAWMAARSNSSEGDDATVTLDEDELDNDLELNKIPSPPVIIVTPE